MKKISLVVALLCIFVFSGICFAQDEPIVEPIEEVSIVSLIADSEDFNGKRVSTSGYFVYNTTEQALYLSTESANNLLTKNGLWVELSDETDLKENINELKNTFCNIQGIVNIDEKGPDAKWSTSLNEVDVIIPLRRMQQVDTIVESPVLQPIEPKATTITPKEIMNIAMEAAKVEDLDLTTRIMYLDKGNADWLQLLNTLNPEDMPVYEYLQNRNYQAIRFSMIEGDGEDVWFFIDLDTGEMLGEYENRQLDE